MTREVPILFSTEMVQAILRGEKTQTRRLVKPQPSSGVRKSPFVKSGLEDGHGTELKAKYLPDDLLWVREGWYIRAWHEYENELMIAFTAGGKSMEYYPENHEDFNRYWEQSCNDLTKAGRRWDEETECYQDVELTDFRRRPSIHMPKDVARIWLKVTDVRLERLQYISEEDAKAEGVKRVVNGDEDFDSICYENYLNTGYIDLPTAKQSFETLWKKINGADSWKANPWVWVVCFEVVSTTGKPDLIQSSKS